MHPAGVWSTRLQNGDLPQQKPDSIFFCFFWFVASDYIWLYPISEIEYGVMDYSDAIAFVRLLAGLTVRFASINIFISCLQLYSSASRPCASCQSWPSGPTLQPWKNLFFSPFCSFSSLSRRVNSNNHNNVKVSSAFVHPTQPFIMVHDSTDITRAIKKIGGPTPNCWSSKTHLVGPFSVNIFEGVGLTVPLAYFLFNCGSNNNWGDRPVALRSTLFVFTFPDIVCRSAMRISTNQAQPKFYADKPEYSTWTEPKHSQPHQVKSLY